ncbi:hypothetical protein CYMTET_31057 [Cymbomonas tetramitiformis]|uniref:Uncharacterized protein n=1 Tax=Cymbomonas tetramitiformis TaxID=36881 RepID=A0AAE0KTK6_9CHLO|nr:hypothetical protein CYMTET_31057 [Cymbomonas tetramitiformis]
MICSQRFEVAGSSEETSRSNLCCEVNPEGTLLAVGSEDGGVTLIDLRNSERCQQKFHLENDVPSLCFSPVHSYSLFIAEECTISVYDLRTGESGDPVQRYNFNQEEVNQIVLNRKGTVLAAADDSGDVKIVDIQKHSLQKTLKGSHSNICSSVQFRPHHPWEVVTGGLDCSLIRWDFNSSRPKAAWNMGADAAASGANEAQVFNPPLVHAVAVGSEHHEFSQQTAAVACGDGTVAIYHLNASRPTLSEAAPRTNRIFSGVQLSE